MPGNAVAVVTWDDKGIGFTIVRAQWRQFLGDAVACAGCSQAAVAKLGVEAVPAATSAGYKQCAGPLGLFEGEATDIQVCWLTMQLSFSKAVAGQLFGGALLWKASDQKVWGQSVRRLVCSKPF